MRGLWLAHTGKIGHVERIEQCGDRTFDLPFTIVTRRMDGDELVWTYPRIEGEVRMRRICRLPDAASGSGRQG